jgi:oligopeptide transport system substrate-binding protein
MKSITTVFFAVAIAILTGSCKQNLWNNPHTDITSQNIVFSSFSEPTKTLDPAKAYDSGSYLFINQIYEPPLQYHYLKRPYQLVPLTAATMPIVTYLVTNDKETPPKSNLPTEKTVYNITIKPHIMFQQNPLYS